MKKLTVTTAAIGLFAILATVAIVFYVVKGKNPFKPASKPAEGAAAGSGAGTATGIKDQAAAESEVQKLRRVA